jgi:hypothetical protein
VVCGYNHGCYRIPRLQHFAVPVCFDCSYVSTADLAAVIAATTELMAQVQAHQATAAKLSSLAVQCGGAPVVMDELEALAGALIQSL